MKGPNRWIRGRHTGFEPRLFQIRATGITIEVGVCEHNSVLTFRMLSCGISELWLFICVMLRFTKGKLNTDLGRFAGLRNTVHDCNTELYKSECEISAASVRCPVDTAPLLIYCLSFMCDKHRYLYCSQLRA